MKYALVYGGISGGIVIAVLVAMMALAMPNHTTSLWFGYLVMLVALSLIFVGVKRYRDVECGGVIRFGRAFGLGLSIAAVAGLIYVIGWEIYLAASGWDFMADYTDSIVKDMRAKGATAAAIDAKMTEMQGMAEMYKKPWMRMPMTFAEIFPVGLLVALVSAALLRNSKLFPAAR